MTKKTKYIDWMKEWKSIEDESEKQIFMEKIKSEISLQKGEELLDGMKAVHSMINDLKSEVFEENAVSQKLLISPSSEEESTLLRNMLKKMNIKFKEIKVA